MHISNSDMHKFLAHFKVNSEKEWQAKVGRGDITSAQLTQGFNQTYANEALNALPFKPKAKKRLIAVE